MVSILMMVSDNARIVYLWPVVNEGNDFLSVERSRQKLGNAAALSDRDNLKSMIIR